MSAYELTKTILKDSANLKAYYRFESGAETTDSSSSGFTLTANGTPTYGAGKYGNAVTTSSGNNLYRNSTTDLDITTGALSFGGWIKFSSLQNSDVFGKLLNSGNLNGYTITVQNSAGNNEVVVFFVNNFGTAAYDSALKQIAINDNNWHLIVATRPTSGGSIRLWIDGQMAASTTNNNRNVTTTAKYSIGSRNAGAANPFSGSIDDAFVFDTELSADQIKELYEGRYIGEWLPQSGLVFGTHLNGSGTDFSGNNLHLSPSGAGATFTLSGKISGCVDYGTGNTGKFLSLVNDATIRGGACTLLCWINTPTTTSANDHETFFAVGDQGTRVSYNIFLGTTGIGAARLKGGVAWQETAQKAISANIWYFAALTYDTTNVSLYVDGNLIGQQAASGTGTGDVVDSINIGARADTGAGVTFSDGKIDEAVIFSRALTAAEIRHWYAWSRGKYL